MNILFYDFETTGLPIWKEPSGGENQPHIVEVYAEVVDGATRQVLDSGYAIVKPDGWIIPQETIDVHGITNERALAEGIPEAEAVANLMRLHDQCQLRVGHNVNFDDRIMRIALKRYMDRPDIPEGQQPSDMWKAGEKFCTMWKSRKQWSMAKIAKLTILYEQRYGEPLVGAHGARVDVMGCKRIYFDLVDGK